MSINISYASRDDLEKINHLFEEILNSLKYYNDAAKKDEKKKYSIEELQNKLEQDNLSIISVFDKSKLVAFSFSRFDDYTIWLEWFGISLDYRSKGLGDLILKELEKSAINRGCHKIWCDSRTENIASFKVLQRNGYTLVTTLKNHWYSQDFFIWEKLLENE